MAEFAHLANNCTGPVYKDGFLVLEECFIRNNDSDFLIPWKGEYIAGIMVVVDCYEGRRVPRSPILIRLENFDLVVSRGKDENIELWAGSINNRLPLCRKLSNANNDSECLIWIADKSAKHLLGEALETIHVDKASAPCLRISTNEEKTISYLL